MLEIFLLSLFIGLIAGLLAGLFGLGGGVVIVPALVWLFAAYNFPDQLIMIMAIATSLSTIVFTAVSSILTHHKFRAIQWGYVARLSPGIIIGSVFGAKLADFLDVLFLKWFFVTYLLFVGIRMVFPQQKVDISKQMNQNTDYLIGSVIGLVSSVLGIGGGTLTVPYLASRQLPMNKAVAVSSVCGLPIAISGAVTYMFLGWRVESIPEWSLGYVYLPALIGIISCSVITAPLGAKLANKLPAKKLKRYFSVVLFLIAFKMILD